VDGRVAVVTGVGRVEGIGFATARRLLDDGYRVLAHTYSTPDGERTAGDPAPAVVFDGFGEDSGRLCSIDADLADPDAPRRVIEAALDAFGAAAELDRAWAVNARAAILLVQAFAASHDDARADGRVVLLTSGQHLGPMPGELPYVLSKGAVHQATRTLADELADRGITVNALNPGPVDTGWPSEELREALASRFPAGRWGRPGDIVPVLAWLLSADSAWVTGQVIDAEGGFRR